MRERLGWLEGVKWYEVLAWYHMAERLHQCLALIEDDDTKRAALRDRWHRQLKRIAGATDGLIRWLRRQRNDSHTTHVKSSPRTLTILRRGNR